MPTYRIIHYTQNDPLGKDVFVTSTFVKTELEIQFHDLVKKLQPGEQAEYMKEDEKHFYPSMAYVANENGKLYSYTAKGHRRLSKFNG